MSKQNYVWVRGDYERWDGEGEEKNWATHNTGVGGGGWSASDPD